MVKCKENCRYVDRLSFPSSFVTHAQGCTITDFRQPIVKKKKPIESVFLFQTELIQVPHFNSEHKSLISQVVVTKQ